MNCGPSSSSFNDGGHTDDGGSITTCPAVELEDGSDSLTHLFRKLMDPSDRGGTPRQHTDPASLQRSRTRKGGPADHIGQLLDGVVATTNDHRGWTGEHALTVREVLHRSEEGGAILRECEVANQDRLLSRNSLELCAMRGGVKDGDKRYSAMTAEVVGVLSKGFSKAEAARVLKVSAGTIQRGRDQIALATINPKAAGPFASLLQKPGGTRTKICDIEMHVTIKWFLSKNPTRSGDTKAIAWMTLEKVDFYFEQYRHCYGGVMKMALDMYPELKERLSGSPGRNQFERNVQLYMRNPDAETKLYEVEAPREELTSALAKAANEDDGYVETPDRMPPSIDAREVEGQFVPRCYEVFYFKILGKTPIRKRPPEKYCNMCAEGPAIKREMLHLQALLAPCDEADQNSELEEEKDPDLELWRWGKYKDRTTATKRLRTVTTLCKKREEHATWYRLQRPEVVTHVHTPHSESCSLASSVSCLSPLMPRSRQSSGLRCFQLWPISFRSNAGCFT
jgi:hypothetical protein